MKIRKIKDFSLSRIDEFFRISAFERKIYPAHVRSIKKAIMDGNLIDNVITICPVSGCNQVVDGQHRIQALKSLWSEGALKTYTFYLREVAKAEKEAYLAINQGKILSSKDMLKAYDDGTVTFFNELKQWANHYGTKSRVSFADILFSYAYTKSGSPFGGRKVIDRYIADIPRHETFRMAEFIETYYRVLGRRTTSFYYKSAIFRNFMRVFFERFKEFHEGTKVFERFLNKFKDDRFLYANQVMRSVEGFGQIYFYINERASKYFEG